MNFAPSSLAPFSLALTSFTLAGSAVFSNSTKISLSVTISVTLNAPFSSVGTDCDDATNLVVPFAQIYYNHKNTEVQTRANVEITKSNNDMMGGMISNYTSNYQNSTNTSTDTSSVSTTNTTSNTTDTNTVTNTTSVPDVSIDTTAGTTSIIK